MTTTTKGPTMTELPDPPMYEALSEIAYPTLSVYVDVAEVLKHFIHIDSDAGGDLPDAPDEAALVFLERVKSIFDPLPVIA